MYSAICQPALKKQSIDYLYLVVEREISVNLVIRGNPDDLFRNQIPDEG